MARRDDTDPTNEHRAASAMAALQSQTKYEDDWPGAGQSGADPAAPPGPERQIAYGGGIMSLRGLLIAAAWIFIGLLLLLGR